MEPLHPIKMHLIGQAFIMSDLEFTKPQPLHLYNKNNVPRPCEEGMKCPHMLFLPLSQLWAALVYIVHALLSHCRSCHPGTAAHMPWSPSFPSGESMRLHWDPNLVRFPPHGRWPWQRAGALLSFKCCFVKCVKHQF